MADIDTAGDAKQLAPPYTSFQTIKTVSEMFKEHGLPGQIDRSVLSNLSGSVQSQVLTALRFLGLIGHHDNAPREPFKKLVEVHGTDEWPNQLATILRAAYSPIFELKLDTASPAQFNEKFRTTYPAADGDTLRKCITFFLNATREANIPVSPYIMKNKKPRAASTKRRSPKSKGPVGDNRNSKAGDAAASGSGGNEGGVGSTSPYEVLMQKIYDPTDMEPGSDEEKAVFTLARYLKVKELEEQDDG